MMKNLSREFDPELIRVTKLALKTDAVLSAVFILMDTAEDISLGRVDEEVHALIKKAEKAVSAKASRVVVFKRLASFAVQGPANLIHEITQSPKIQGGTFNKGP